MISKAFFEELKTQVGKATIVAATKYGDASKIKVLYDLGIRDFGENRVQAFLEKKEALKDLDITWHFIGHLQSKKVKKMINDIDVLHSLDRLSLAEQIQKYRTTPLSCFIEVNISNEAQKQGLDISDVKAFCEKMKNYDKIHIVGLMGMAKLTPDDEEIKASFDTLRTLRDELMRDVDLSISGLSMGMSNDYPLALESGATHVRLGSILF